MTFLVDLAEVENATWTGLMEVWDNREIDPFFLLPLREIGIFRTIEGKFVKV